MKVAYKITLPLVIVITVMIWFVTDRFNTAQAQIVHESQEKSALEITKQFEKNKTETLKTLNKNVQVTASMIAETSVNDVWNFTYENLQQTLTKYLELKYIQGVEIYEDLKDSPKISVGTITPNLNKITKDILYTDGKVIGYAKIYYDDQYIIEYFQESKKELLERIEKSNQEQDSYIDQSIKKRTFVNLLITVVVLVMLLLTIYKIIIKPLNKLEKGLNSFFNYLQNKSDSVEKIEIHSDDEFGKMGKTLNENIAVTAKLHEEIYELNINLEEKIAKRTHQLKEKSEQIAQLLDNAEEGFLSYGENLLVDSEYSKECRNIFQQDISNLHIASILFSDESEDQELFIKVMGDIFNPKIKQKRKQVFLHLLPKEFCINQNYIKVEYKIISASKIMLILVDITEKKKLEKKVEQEKQTLKMVVSVVSDITEFKEIVSEYKEFCATTQNYIQDEKRFLNAMIEYYRMIHTFKGNFAQKDLLYIVPKLHEYESQINNLVKDPDRSFEEFQALVKQNNLIEWIDEDIEVIENILDQNIMQKDDTINVSESLVSKIENDIKQILHFPKDERDVTYEDLFKDVVNMRRKPLHELLKSFPKLVDQLSKRLDKKIYPLKITGGEDIFVSEAIQPFIKTLVHIFRNSIDHGIENFEERVASGKDEKATVACDIEQVDDNIVINIIDDGKGIDTNIIKQKALQKNIFSEDEIANMSRKDILMVIFLDTFSTKEEVTQLSGRGVGLGAVKGEIDKLEGEIDIESTLLKGTAFKFTIPLRNIT